MTFNIQQVQESLIRDEIKELAKKGPVSLKKYKSLYINSYERHYLLEYLDDEAFVYVCKLCLDNLPPPNRYSTTYQDVVIDLLFPQLLSRFRRSKIKKVDPEYDSYMDWVQEEASKSELGGGPQMRQFSYETFYQYRNCWFESKDLDLNGIILKIESYSKGGVKPQGWDDEIDWDEFNRYWKVSPDEPFEPAEYEFP